MNVTTGCPIYICPLWNSEGAFLPSAFAIFYKFVPEQFLIYCISGDYWTKSSNKLFTPCSYQCQCLDLPKNIWLEYIQIISLFILTRPFLHCLHRCGHKFSKPLHSTKTETIERVLLPYPFCHTQHTSLFHISSLGLIPPFGQHTLPRPLQSSWAHLVCNFWPCSCTTLRSCRTQPPLMDLLEPSFQCSCQRCVLN